MYNEGAFPCVTVGPGVPVPHHIPRCYGVTAGRRRGILRALPADAPTLDSNLSWKAYARRCGCVGIARLGGRGLRNPRRDKATLLMRRNAPHGGETCQP